MPRAYFLAFLLAAPLTAQMREVVLRFQPSDCASCLASLEPRIKRIRGVEEAFLDAENRRVAIVLLPDNRIRLSRLIDVIAQDGTTVESAEIKASGDCASRDGVWSFRIPTGAFRLTGKHPAAPGPCTITGRIAPPFTSIEASVVQ